MGYACPVCEDPQADAGHLANHLAFTALTSSADHEEWLDERVPEWDQLGEAELAERVVEHAEETEYPQVFEASGVEDGHDHASGGLDLSQARERGRSDVGADTRAILEEARELSPDGTASADDDGAANEDTAATRGDDETSDDDATGDDTAATDADESENASSEDETE